MEDALNIEKVMAVLREQCKEYPPHNLANTFQLGRFAGMNVYEAPQHQSIKVRDDCPMTDEGREEMNLWLLEMFGMRSAIPKNQVWFMQGMNAVIANPGIIAKIITA